MQGLHKKGETLSLSNDESGLFAISLEAQGPLAEAHFRFNHQVNAVYGKNGAGKTWLLRSAHRALNGLRGDHSAFLYYRIADDIFTADDPYADAIQYALLTDINRKSFSSPVFELDMSTGRVLPERPLSTVVDKVVRLEHHIAEGTAFHQELLSSREFVLVPQGIDRHEWRVYLAVTPSSDTPAINAMIDYWRFPDPPILDDEVIDRLNKATEDHAHEEQAREILERVNNHHELVAELEDNLNDLGVTSHDAWESFRRALNSFPSLLDQHLPIPLLPLCDLRLGHGFSILVGEDDDGLENRTLNALVARVPAIIEAMNLAFRTSRVPYTSPTQR